jgi:hypothetical protein
MTDEQLAAMHRLLAEYHRGLAKEAVLDVIQEYHSGLAQQLSDEAALIPRRTAIVERLRELERQKKRPTTSKPRRPCQACGAKSADVRPDFNWDKRRPDERQSG